MIYFMSHDAASLFVAVPESNCTHTFIALEQEREDNYHNTIALLLKGATTNSKR